MKNILNQNAGKFSGYIFAGIILLFFVLAGLWWIVIPAVIFIFIAFKKSFNPEILNKFNFFKNNINMETNSQNQFQSAGKNIRNKIPIQGLGKKIVKIILLIVVIVIALKIFAAPFIIVGAGETGVQSLFGKVRDKELSSGFHIINPLSNVEKMSIRTEQYTMSIAPAEGQVKGDDSISSLTKEGLDVNIDFTALYRLEESKASDIYREVGLDYVGKLIRPEIRGVIRDVVSQYEAKELYSEKRQEASSHIAILLKERLESRGIIIEEAVIRNVSLPASLAKAIQEKLASEQEAQRYDFVLEKEKKEADRKRIEAEGQRDSQKIINESLSGAYLDYLYINQLKDRQGTIYVPINPSNGMPLFKGVGD